MSAGTVDRRNGPLRHEALLYADDAEYLAGTTAFVHEGLARGEIVVAAVTPDRGDLLREALGSAAARVRWADVTQVARNPARLIAAWHRFVDDNLAPGQRLRGIGQPVWPGRSEDELVECHHHEALANVSFADTPAWLLCPYDTSALDPAVIDRAYRSHPGIARRGERSASEAYAGAEEARATLLAPLPEPDEAPHDIAIERTRLRDVRRFVAEHGTAAGLDAERVEALVLVANELATNSLRHGGGRGVLRAWSAGDTVVTEVRDAGRIDEPLVGRRHPPRGQRHGRGLWLVNELCDLVQLRSSDAGTTVRVHLRRR